MHELGLTQSILEIALEHAQKNGAKPIQRIKVKAGEMVAIVEDSMQFHFEHLRVGTLAENAELDIDIIPLQVKCSSCGETSKVNEWEIFLCPVCGATTVEVVAGREFYVESLEVED